MKRPWLSPDGIWRSPNRTSAAIPSSGSGCTGGGKRASEPGTGKDTKDSRDTKDVLVLDVLEVLGVLAVLDAQELAPPPAPPLRPRPPVRRVDRGRRGDHLRLCPQPRGRAWPGLPARAASGRRVLQLPLDAHPRAELPRRPLPSGDRPEADESGAHGGIVHPPRPRALCSD